jgi:uncharacterized cysteine cluster protein YcgN (CxxCxxCC family)
MCGDSHIIVQQPAARFFIQYESEFGDLDAATCALPIHCLNNSVLARTARVKEYTDQNQQPHVCVYAQINAALDSTQLQDPPITVGQILNAMPLSTAMQPVLAQQLPDDAAGYYWRNFGLYCGIPLAFFGAGALFSTYVRKLDSTKLAYITAALGGISIVWGLCTMNSSDATIRRVYKNQIDAAMARDTNAAPRSESITQWLGLHKNNAGIFERLRQQCGLRNVFDENQVPHYALERGADNTHNVTLLDALNINEKNYLATCAAIRNNYKARAIRYYTAVHQNLGLIRLCGGMATAVVALSVVYMGKTTDFTLPLTL